MAKPARDHPFSLPPNPPEVTATLEDRRSFLAKFASAIFGGMVFSGVPLGAKADAQAQTSFPALPQMEGEDVLLRMQRDLQTALGRHSVKWGMVIDLRKCVGCHACTVSCIAENHLPPGVVYRPVTEQEIGTYPNVSWSFLPRPCMHCDNPPCIPPCPADATHKRADGIVDIDYAKCIGCQKCVDACPYGARSFDEGDNWTDKTPGKGKMPYEQLPTLEYGKTVKREADDGPNSKVRKCSFCAHRLEQGLLPQCVTTCVGRATFFGDLSDPGSVVSELVKHPQVMRLKEELGTKPSVYYISKGAKS